MCQLSLTKYALRSLVQAYPHCRHLAGLLQCYTSRNSWRCDETAAISSDHCRWFSTSIRNNFLGPLSLLTQPHWLLVWRRIVSKSTFLSLPIWTLHMTGLKFLRSSLVAGINWIINAKSTDISFASYGPIVCHWIGSNSSWKLIILNSNEHCSWCFCDSWAVYKCDHLVSSVASLDIRSCKFCFSAAC